VQGNYNAHHVAYPQIDWRKFGGKFVEGHFRFTPLFPDNTNRTLRSFAAFFDALKNQYHYHRFRQRYLDLCFHGIFQTKKIKGEIGSSAMPHKVNPIDFENSEGNLGIAMLF
jgi:adenylosuccinate lyase